MTSSTTISLILVCVFIVIVFICIGVNVKKGSKKYPEFRQNIREDYTRHVTYKPLTMLPPCVLGETPETSHCLNTNQRFWVNMATYFINGDVNNLIRKWSPASDVVYVFNGYIIEGKSKIEQAYNDITTYILSGY